MTPKWLLPICAGCLYRSSGQECARLSAEGFYLPRIGDEEVARSPRLPSGTRPARQSGFGLRLCIRTASQQLGCRSTRTFPLPLGCRALSPRQLLWPLSAHGSMQILTGKPDEMVTFATSGWQEAGFDWNRIPGVTSIHLPLDQLRARVLNVDTFSRHGGDALFRRSFCRRFVPSTSER